MQESQMAERLTLQWVPVVDARGRTQLEARWSTPTSGSRTSVHPHAA